MKVYITRNIPDSGIKMLRDKGYEVDINSKDKVLSKSELIKNLKKKDYNAVLCLLTDKIDGEVFDAAKNAKIFANYAVGFDNIDLEAAKQRGVMVANTPGVLNEAVAEHAVALMLAASRRIVEADSFSRKGKYKGWAPMLFLGNSLFGKTVGIVGLGRIGSRVAHMVSDGFGAKVVYYDLKRNEDFEREFPNGSIEYKEDVDEALRESDFISIHLPLTEKTKHIINKEKLSLMKPGALLVNTSRGPIIDEAALAEALKNGRIKGAALDVFEFEPKITKALTRLSNVVLTPHIASATEEARSKMAELAAINIIEVLEGRTPPASILPS
ncbi:D-glycerate dehydrogenase [Candidatus Parcubacteria bacterium]|nr:MAG: D-glycerate dehydrogenase [Candidatus Parcubacteria bacterium]